MNPLGFLSIGAALPFNNFGAFVVDSSPVPQGRVWLIRRYTLLLPNFGFSSGSENNQSGLYLSPSNAGPPPANGPTSASLPTPAQFVKLFNFKLDITNNLVSNGISARTAYQASFGKPIPVPPGWIIRAAWIGNGGLLGTPMQASIEYEDFPIVC